MAAKQVGFCAVAACVGLAASVALADPNGGPSVANPYGQVDVAPGQFYVGAAVGVQWMTLPGWEYGSEDISGLPPSRNLRLKPMAGCTAAKCGQAGLSTRDQANIPVSSWKAPMPRAISTVARLVPTVALVTDTFFSIKVGPA